MVTGVAGGHCISTTLDTCAGLFGLEVPFPSYLHFYYCSINPFLVVVGGGAVCPF